MIIPYIPKGNKEKALTLRIVLAFPPFLVFRTVLLINVLLFRGDFRFVLIFVYLLNFFFSEKYLQECWPIVKGSLKEHGIACELNLVS